MRVRVSILLPGTGFASAGRAQASAAGGPPPAWSPAPGTVTRPTSCTMRAAAACASCAAPGCA